MGPIQSINFPTTTLSPGLLGVGVEGVSWGLCRCLERPEGNFWDSKWKAFLIWGLFLMKSYLVCQEVEHIARDLGSGGGEHGHLNI